MYLVHDLYSAAIMRWRKNARFNGIKSAIVKHWPRVMVYPDTYISSCWQGEEGGRECYEQAVLTSTPVECYAPMWQIKWKGEYLGDTLSTMSPEWYKTHLQKVVAGVGLTRDDVVGWQNAKDATFLKLVPYNEISLTDTEITDYINTHSVLQDEAHITKVQEARSRSLRLARWVATEDYLDNPLPYDPLDPNFPTTQEGIYESQALEKNIDWTEITVRYSDRPSAVIDPNNPYYGHPKAVIIPTTLNVTEIKSLLTSGYFSSVDYSLDAVVDPTELRTRAAEALAAINGTDEYSTIPTREQIKDQIAGSAWRNGTLEITDVVGPDKDIAFAVVIEGSTNHGIYSRDNIFSINPNQALFDTNVDVLTNTIVLDDPNYNVYYDDFNTTPKYLPRYLREVVFKVKFRRRIAATVSSPTVVKATGILTNFYSSKNSVDKLLTKVINDIQPVSIDSVYIKGMLHPTDTTLTFLDNTIAGHGLMPQGYGSKTLPVPYDSTASFGVNFNAVAVPTGGDYYISVEKFSSLSAVDAAQVISKSFDVYVHQNSGGSFLDFVLVAISVIAVFFAPYIAQYIGIMLGTGYATAYAILAGGLSALSMVAAKNGLYSGAIALGGAATVIGMGTMLSNGINNLNSLMTSSTGFAETVTAIYQYEGLGAVLQYTYSVIESYVIDAMSELYTSSIGAITDGITNLEIGSTLSGLNRTASLIVDGFKLWVKMTDPYGGATSANSNENYDNPVRSDSFQTQLEMVESPVFNCFELPEMCGGPQLYNLLNQEGMCAATLTKYYS